MEQDEYEFYRERKNIKGLRAKWRHLKTGVDRFENAKRQYNTAISFIMIEFVFFGCLIGSLFTDDIFLFFASVIIGILWLAYFILLVYESLARLIEYYSFESSGVK